MTAIMATAPTMKFRSNSKRGIGSKPEVSEWATAQAGSIATHTISTPVGLSIIRQIMAEFVNGLFRAHDTKVEALRRLLQPAVLGNRPMPPDRQEFSFKANGDVGLEAAIIQRVATLMTFRWREAITQKEMRRVFGMTYALVMAFGVTAHPFVSVPGSSNWEDP